MTVRNEPYVRGKWIAPSSHYEAVIDPATGEVFARAPVAAVEDMERAIAATRGSTW